MSYPNTPNPNDPYGQGGQQPGQGDSGGYPPPGHPQQPGGYPPPPGGQQPGGYPPPGSPQTGGYQAPHDYGQPQQPGGYPPPPGAHPGQYGNYPQGGPGGFGDSSAVTGQPNQDERTMGLITHLLGILTGFLGPLIMYLIKKDESPFIRDQAAQALNFQLLLLIGYLVSFVLYIIVIGAVLQLVIWVCAIVFGIMGGMAANKGEWYRYPFNVSWVK
ncbi:DUF4870 domain-containing protein [Nocardiopsis ganjiahuensis]|uniref:DUF4870 domain-containing protein n=1 Tax=Nocardiopsis ganjiahuensis TaxID=239984 RepID=UPI00034C74B5|nr:DUF4870 domain-containing protein [Nocardiopsis ganjiahuensis]